MLRTLQESVSQPPIKNDKVHSNKLRKEKILRTIESDEDLVDKIQRELDEVYHAVERGRTPQQNIWDTRSFLDTNLLNKHSSKNTIASVLPIPPLPTQDLQLEAPPGALTTREQSLLVINFLVVIS